MKAKDVMTRSAVSVEPTANATDKANVRQTGVETAMMMPDVFRMYGERKE